eukprot:1036055_1
MKRKGAWNLILLLTQFWCAGYEASRSPSVSPDLSARVGKSQSFSLSPPNEHNNAFSDVSTTLSINSEYPFSESPAQLPTDRTAVFAPRNDDIFPCPVGQSSCRSARDPRDHPNTLTLSRIINRGADSFRNEAKRLSDHIGTASIAHSNHLPADTPIVPPQFNSQSHRSGYYACKTQDSHRSGYVMDVDVKDDGDITMSSAAQPPSLPLRIPRGLSDPAIIRPPRKRKLHGIHSVQQRSRNKNMKASKTFGDIVKTFWNCASLYNQLDDLKEQRKEILSQPPRRHVSDSSVDITRDLEMYGYLLGNSLIDHDFLSNPTHNSKDEFLKEVRLKLKFRDGDSDTAEYNINESAEKYLQDHQEYDMNASLQPMLKSLDHLEEQANEELNKAFNLFLSQSPWDRFNTEKILKRFIERYKEEKREMNILDFVKDEDRKVQKEKKKSKKHPTFRSYSPFPSANESDGGSISF